MFEDASGMLKFVSGVEITAKQVERICHYHGGQIEKDIQEKIKAGEDKVYLDNEVPHYVMIDGSMYLTR